MSESGQAANSQNVVWLISAQQKLASALAEKLSTEVEQTDGDRQSNSFLDHMSRVNTNLFQTFPNAQTIVVLDRFEGFSRKLDLDTLLVQVFGDITSDNHQREISKKNGSIWGVASAAFIVKLAQDSDRLEQEYSAWSSCLPPGFQTNSILTPLTVGATDTSGRSISLLYGDASSLLGAGDVMTFEAAFVAACRFGVPDIQSVCHSLRQLFDQLEKRFYCQSFLAPICLHDASQPPEGGSESQGRSNLCNRVRRELPKWQDSKTAGEEGATVGSLVLEERKRHRREILGMLASRPTEFIDPCDYISFLFTNQGRPLCPDILYGCAHGDLHGRNMIVNVAEEKIGSLAVFDYEDFARNNAIGWDFVKLETELKIRVYTRLFAWPSDFIWSVHQIEVLLARCTRNLNERGELTDEPTFPGGPEVQRLCSLILSIRALAKEHLGKMRHRPVDWLEEYYFLLGCYGVYTIKFENYSRDEFAAAYISAGAAVRQMSLCQRVVSAECRNAVSAAATQRDVLLDERQDSDWNAAWSAVSKRLGEESASYVGKLAFLKEFTRSIRKSEANEKSYDRLRASLEQLGAAYPHAIEIDEELCLFLAESGDDELADQVLQQIESRYSIRPEETLCRFGRRYKERSLEFLDSSHQGLSTEAEKHLRRALEYYQEAYRLHGGYYPGINVASLMYVLKINDYREVANEVRGRLPADFTKSVWGLATLGEIHFLLDDHGKAQELYREAVSRPECQPQNRDSMRRQLELLLRFSEQKVRDAWQPYLDIMMGRGE